MIGRKKEQAAGSDVSSREQHDARSSDPSRGYAEDYRRKIEAKQAKRLEREGKKHAHKRREARSDCFAVATLAIPDRGYRLDGVVKEASHGGLTFRPASTFIEFLTGDSAQVVFEGGAKNGIIRASRPDGYGIQLFDAFTDEELDRLRDVSLDLSDYRDVV